MGILDLFKSNYTRIAENTTKYYLELKNNYSHRFNDDTLLYATTGVLDAQYYIFIEQSLNINTILSLSRQIILNDDETPDFFPYKYSYIAAEKGLKKFKQMSTREIPTEGFDEEKPSFEDDPLFNFVFCLEIIIFTLDNPRLLRSDIALACYEKANTINKAIQKVRKNQIIDPIFKRATKTFMESDDLKEVRAQLGIQD